MSSTASHPARTASLRVSQQEYDALQKEAQRQGYKLSHLMRHRIFGRTSPPVLTGAAGSFSAVGKQLTALSKELGENGLHIRLIAESLDEGFRNAFGLDFCLRLLERLSGELQHVLTQFEHNAIKAPCCRCEEQTS